MAVRFVPDVDVVEELDFIPEGWYDAPGYEGQFYRWWDGEDWTRFWYPIHPQPRPISEAERTYRRLVAATSPEALERAARRERFAAVRP